MEEELYTVELITYIRGAINLYHQNALSPIQRACILGHKNRLSMLIKERLAGASNNNEDINTALYLAVVRGNANMVNMIICMGGFDEKRAIHKAIHMAKVIEKYDCLEVLQNYVPTNFMEVYTKPVFDNTTLIPLGKLNEFQEFLMDVNLNPVHVVLNLDKFGLRSIYKELTQALELHVVVEMSKISGRNELIALKLYYFSLILSDLKRCARPVTEVSGPQHNLIHHFIKYITDKKFNGKSYIDYVMSELLNCFPFQESILLNTIKFKLHKQKNPASTLWIFRNVLNGGKLQPKDPKTMCSCCGNETIKKTCTKCNAVKYCSMVCEIYHKFIHERTCTNPEVKPC